MIKQLLFKFGAAPGGANLVVDVTPVTVFVGPNNAGKSRILMEIERHCRMAPTSVGQGALLESVQFTALTQAQIETELAKIEQKPNLGEHVNPDHILIARLNPQTNQANRVQIHKPAVIMEAQHPNSRHGHFANFLSLYTLRLDGTNRLNLLNDQVAGDLKATPVNHLAHLFGDDKLRREVRRIVYEAFGKYFVIDPTNIGQLSVRLSEREPSSDREEKGWEEESVKFHKAAIPMGTASDGVRAFTGIITTILAGDPKVTLVDEPEAFLHPAMASKLGNEISKSAAQTDDRLFFSTHSATFLMGCIQSGVPLNIVRLTYNYSAPTARLLPREKLLPLMRHPLLRSTGVLQGLFYEAVIVTESDADRAFYQEVNERLLARNDPRGIANSLFINAQNKQTVWEIVKPLRDLGIPAAGVVDIDVLKDGGVVWTKALTGAFIPQISHQALHAQRQSILAALERTNRNMKREGGIGLLAGTEAEAAENLLSQLADYGMFVVPGGELESWLKGLGATGHSPGWLISIFEKMGEDPSQQDYVWPMQGDVWDFIGLMKNWVVAPARRGIPS